MKETFPLKAMLKGGGQERSFRSGTENLIGIISFATALRDAMSERRSHEWKRVATYRDWMEQELMTFCPNATVVGKDVPRLMNTTGITMPGLKAATQVMRFDLEGIAVSAGAACSSGKIKKSRVLSAMGVNDAIAETVLRVSLPPKVNQKDIESFVSTWKNIYQSINHTRDPIKTAAVSAA
jgi:cysteine desulfurase